MRSNRRRPRPPASTGLGRRRALLCAAEAAAEADYVTELERENAALRDALAQRPPPPGMEPWD